MSHFVKIQPVNEQTGEPSGTRYVDVHRIREIRPMEPRVHGDRTISKVCWLEMDYNAPGSSSPQSYIVPILAATMVAKAEARRHDAEPAEQPAAPPKKTPAPPTAQPDGA